LEQLSGASARDNVGREIILLQSFAKSVLTDSNNEVRELMGQLKSLNTTLWDIENKIRAKEAAAQFDSDFINLARSVYRFNDVRAKVKRQINLALKSELSEEKSYWNY
jgi:biopolymer transport protein ExbB/TolQ